MEALTDILGSWKGTNRVWLKPGDDPLVSESELHVSTTDQGFRLDYLWEESGLQEGSIVVYPVSGSVTANWIDTWHTSEELYTCEGTSDAGLDVLTHYPAGEGEPWGWRINVIPEGEKLRLQMYNIPPGTQGVLAVECEYSRIYD
ncbi:MAG: hypothetical protein ACXAE3_12095 [Candidatus Kariarchaeaceae archaeon]|jgi:hypothetical protein